MVTSSRYWLPKALQGSAFFANDLYGRVLSTFKHLCPGGINPGDVMKTNTRVNILMVDDEPANLTALEAILEDLGQNLVKAHSGKEALRHVLEQDFAVILLDVQMADIDGIETAT